jgi:TetR/AcrR family transcriptional repressor of nem operon
MKIKHDRAKAINQGIHLFTVNGYSRVGVDQICRETGMTKGAFYNAFGSKLDFLRSVISAYASANREMMRVYLIESEASQSAINQIRGFYTMIFDLQPDAIFSGCLINNMMSEVSSLEPGLAKLLDQEFGEILKLIEPYIQKAQQKGEIDPAVNARELADLLHTTCYGALTRAKSLQDCQYPKRTMNLLIDSLVFRKA